MKLELLGLGDSLVICNVRSSSVEELNGDVTVCSQVDGWIRNSFGTYVSCDRRSSERVLDQWHNTKPNGVAAQEVAKETKYPHSNEFPRSIEWSLDVRVHFSVEVKKLDAAKSIKFALGVNLMVRLEIHQLLEVDTEAVFEKRLLHLFTV